MLVPYNNELYRCDFCEKGFKQSEVNVNWKCPDCKKPICIKVEIGEYLHSCHRLKPTELESGYSLTFDRKHTHEIINVSPYGNTYKVALRDYGTMNFNKNDFALVIDGAWVELNY